MSEVVLDNGNTEGERFARTGRGFSDDIVALENIRYAGLLNGRRLCEFELGHTREYFRRKPEGVPRRHIRAVIICFILESGERQPGLDIPSPLALFSVVRFNALFLLLPRVSFFGFAQCLCVASLRADVLVDRMLSRGLVVAEAGPFVILTIFDMSIRRIRIFQDRFLRLPSDSLFRVNPDCSAAW